MGVAMEVPAGEPTTVPDIERDAHERAVRMPIAAIVFRLQEVLGQALTAVVAGAPDAKAVDRWARGERVPHARAEKRLRDAYQVVEMLCRVETPATVRVWLYAMNPALDDDSPAEAISRDTAAVLHAARYFAANG
jgi:hypothetical protein